jgi:HSP20 family protein
MAHRITSPFGTVSISPFEHDSVLEKLFESRQEGHREYEPTVLPVDIYEDDEQFLVSADLPGFSKDEIQISLTEGMLTINAEATPDETKTGGHWLKRERRHGQYVRSIRLTGNYPAKGITAALNAGVLTVTVSKPKRTEPKTIEISE